MQRIDLRRIWVNPRALVTRLLLYLVVLSGAVSFILPFAWTVRTSIMPPWQVYTIPPEWIPKEYHFENYLILIGRLGWRTAFSRQLEIETGVKLFLPVSPFRSPHFRFREMGGGVARTGKSYGSDELRQTVTACLQASF